MVQILLKDVNNTGLTIWAADSVKLGDRVRWNGSSWFVSAVYGTRFQPSDPHVRRCERPDENPLERFD